MKGLSYFTYLLHKLKYPVSSPQEIAHALGIGTQNFSTLQEFVSFLTKADCRPIHLKKFMSRERAESFFQSAVRKESFQKSTLFSYYFNEGWMELALSFDEHSRLRRLYLHHKHLENEKGIEIPLD